LFVLFIWGLFVVLADDQQWQKNWQRRQESIQGDLKFRTLLEEKKRSKHDAQRQDHEFTVQSELNEFERNLARIGVQQNANEVRYPRLPAAHIYPLQ